MAKHPFRVIEGGATSAQEPPADLPPELAGQLIGWFFADVVGCSVIEAGRLMQRRLEALGALTHGLTEGIAAGLNAAQLVDRSAREASFAKVLSETRESLTREFTEAEE